MSKLRQGNRQSNDAKRNQGFDSNFTGSDSAAFYQCRFYRNNISFLK